MGDEGSRYPWGKGTGSRRAKDGASSTRQYFDHLELLIIELRGAPLLMGPKEWQVARAWREEGIPLELVDRTLRQLAAKLDEKRNPRPMTLTYAKRAVRAAWKAYGELQAPATPADLPDLDPVARLRELSEALPDGLAERWGEQLRGLEGTAEEIEVALAELEERIRAEIEAGWSAEDRASLEAELEGALGSLATRLPSAEVERARARLRTRLVRERAGLPILSLFG